MKTMSYLIPLLCLSISTVHGALEVRFAEAKRIGEKSAVKLILKNTFSEKVESARATLFLLDRQGKPVEQITRWVLGGAEERPSLAPGGSATYNFVINTQKPFSTTKLVFSRIVLEGGKSIDPRQAFKITK